MVSRPRSHYAFSNTSLTIISLLLIIWILPIVLYLLAIGYYNLVIFLLANYTSIMDPSHIMITMCVIPIICILGIFMIIVYYRDHI